MYQPPRNHSKREDIFKYLSEIDHDKEVKSMSELFSTLNDRKGEVLTTILEHTSKFHLLHY